MDAASVVQVMAGAYLLIGVMFAIAFVTFGVARVDPAARGAPIGFRLLILPGSIALWPVLLRKWTAR